MSGKKKLSSDVSAYKMQRKCICFDVKLQVLRQLEAGERKVDVGASLNMAMFMIRTTTKIADNIRAYAPTTLKFSAIDVTHSRSCLLVEIVRRLGIWVDDQTRWNMP